MHCFISRESRKSELLLLSNHMKCAGWIIIRFFGEQEPGFPGYFLIQFFSFFKKRMTRGRGREVKKDRRKQSSESDSLSSDKSGDLSRDVFVGNIPKTATKKDVAKAMGK